MVKRLTILFFADDSCPSIPDAVGDLKSVCEDKLSDIDYTIKLIYLGWAGAVEAPEGVEVDSDARRYGIALRDAVEAGDKGYILTLDSGFRSGPDFIPLLLEQAAPGRIVIGSRHVKQGCMTASLLRRAASKLGNRLVARILDLPVRDLSSSIRLYPRELFLSLDTKSEHFDVLVEMAVKCYSAGYEIREVPFHYVSQPRGFGRAQGFAGSFFRVLGRAWRLRNSIFSADYDERAYHSFLWPQRYWQRKRFSIIHRMLDRGGFILDAGCGSSRIIQSLPHAVALDIQRNKLRYLTATNPLRVQGSTFELPFADESFDTVISSQVIEHVEDSPDTFREWRRVLKPGGTLIVGTPDYSRRRWRWVEAFYKHVVPGGYADEHVTQYTFKSLKEKLIEHGFEYIEHDYVAGGELIIKATRV